MLNKASRCSRLKSFENSKSLITIWSIYSFWNYIWQARHIKGILIGHNIPKMPFHTITKQTTNWQILVLGLPSIILLLVFIGVWNCKPVFYIIGVQNGDWKYISLKLKLFIFAYEKSRQRVKILFLVLTKLKKFKATNIWVLSLMSSLNLTIVLHH